jgi:hypothetical protein
LFWAGYRGVEEGSVRPSPTKKSAIKAVYRDITVAVSLRARKAHRATATTRERERERERERVSESECVRERECVSL